MLVLSRKVEENIVIPDFGIEIQVLKVRGRSVAIGINAPTDVKVLRGELVDDTAKAAICGMEAAAHQNSVY